MIIIRKEKEEIQTIGFSQTLSGDLFTVPSLESKLPKICDENTIFMKIGDDELGYSFIDLHNGIVYDRDSLPNVNEPIIIVTHLFELVER